MVVEGTERRGHVVVEGTERTGDVVVEGTERTGDVVVEGTERTGDVVVEETQTQTCSARRGSARTSFMVLFYVHRNHKAY